MINRKVIESHVLSYLCELHKQARKLELAGDKETGRAMRKLIGKLLSEFENWQKSQTHCIRCEKDVGASRFYCDDCLT